MLPFGVITSPNTPSGALKNTSLTHAMQRTQMTLWAVARSPLMFGGDATELDHWTLGLLTNPTVLAINAHGSNLNKPVPLMAGSSSSCYAWQAQATSSGEAQATSSGEAQATSNDEVQATSSGKTSSPPRAFIALFNKDNSHKSSVAECRVSFSNLSVVRSGNPITSP